jgi:glycogen debranching enzyme
MDNTPRGRGDYETLLWFDAAAQQGLAARSIAEMAAAIGEEELRDRFLTEYRRKTELVQRYWDPDSGAFFDRRSGDGFRRVLTPAVFWPLAAGMATPEQAERVAALVADPEKLGGLCPCPTVSHDDPDFSPDGLYWRGAVWVPLVFMTSVALRNYGRHDLAAGISRKLLDHMHRTWRDWSPHSIWECYKPDRPEPALNSKGRLCRADFCGWSALGPISLFLEDVIGIEEVSAAESKVRWRLSSARRHGVRRLSFGENTVSLLYDRGRIEVTAARPFTLEVDSMPYACPAGTSSFAFSHGSTPPSRT